MKINSGENRKKGFKRYIVGLTILMLFITITFLYVVGKSVNRQTGITADDITIFSSNN